MILTIVHFHVHECIQIQHEFVECSPEKGHNQVILLPDLTGIYMFKEESQSAVRFQKV